MKKISLAISIICFSISFVNGSSTEKLNAYKPVKTSPLPLFENYATLPNYVKEYFHKYNEYAIGDNCFNKYTPNPSSLCFSGGGAKGVAYTGTLCYLKSAGILQNVKNFSGASAGSIAAGMVSLCYRNGKLDETLFNKLIEKMMGISYWKFVAPHETYNMHIFDQPPENWKNIWGEIGILVNMATKIHKHRGFIKGDAVVDVFKETFNELTGHENLTFSEHHSLTGTHLVLMACSVSYSSSAVFDYKTVPNMPVGLAMRASMAIPLCFNPVQELGDWFVDGGTTNNYPVWYFDENSTENAGTVGFVLDTRNDLMISYENLNGKENFITYILNIVFGLLLDNEQGVFLRNMKRSVTIDTGNVGTLSFYMSLNDELQAIYNGFMAAQYYFQKECDFEPWKKMWDQFHSTAKSPEPNRPPIGYIPL